LLRERGRVRDNFRRIDALRTNPHLNPLPFSKGRGGTHPQIRNW